MSSFFRFRGLAAWLLGLGLILALGGCSPASLIFGGGMAGSSAAEDQRDFSGQWSDTIIRLKIMRNLATDAEINPFPLTIAVYQGHVTVAGLVKDRRTLEEIKRQIALVEGTKTVSLNLQVKEAENKEEVKGTD